MANKQQMIYQAIKTKIWRKYCGENFKTKCCVEFCINEISISNFEAGFILAEAKGGDVSVDNLIPICSKCNKSIGNKHLREWEQEYRPGVDVKK
jgi:hypothetical protein